MAIGCPTATSFEPSGASILAKYLHSTFHERIKKTDSIRFRINCSSFISMRKKIIQAKSKSSF